MRRFLVALPLCVACKPAATVAPVPPVVLAPEPAPVEAAEPEPEPEIRPELVAGAAALIQAGLADPQAYPRLAELVDRWPHRLSGSDALEEAIAWAMNRVAADGLFNARREKVMVPHGERGRESAEMPNPQRQPLRILGLGGTVGARNLRAAVAVVPNLEAIDARDDLSGKIVLVNQAMPPFDHEHHDSGYGHVVGMRGRAASRAAARGAKAVLVRSLTAHSLATPHTGALRYDPAQPKIPAAAITVEDAERLARWVARGPVEVELNLGAKTRRDAESANVVAELLGRELPEEIVVIGAHIDAWDVGAGAHDDGAGCVMVMEAARLMQQAGLRPRRTVRVVLFTNEENGLRGAHAYAEAHADETHVAAIEADMGAFEPRGFSVAGNAARVADVRRYAALLTPLGADTIEGGYAGADINPLIERGAVGLGLRPDGSKYFDIHHTDADTLDKVDPDHLQRNAVAIAIMAYVLAER